jgi:glycosyltransferase involved in cell wall biosynthesis
MKVVILHYHLNPGGITRIIESQIRAIYSASEGTTLSVLIGNDSKSVDLSGTIIQVNSILDYRNPSLEEEHFEENALTIAAVIKSNLSDSSVLHCHNPNLGKNPALTLAVYRLAMEGHAVVNHCHDFPEDRPANLEILEKFLPRLTGLPLSEILYPNLSRYHFITLNSCDYERILKKEIPASRIHLLPNPVSLLKQNMEIVDPVLKKKICRRLGFDTHRKICTYPVRAIERKNLGEFILLAALFTDEAIFTVTQPPMNPLELPLYNRWKNFCMERSICVKFESGREVNHEELIHISDFCITTSVREGFGMVYLEPWLAGTPVIGRDLPCVTNDLRKHGIEFSRLYSGLYLEKNEQMVDFKDLEIEHQEKFIAEIASHESTRSKFLRDNPFLMHILDDFPPDVILRNQIRIKEEFSLEKYGNKLLAIYREVSQ